MTDLSDEAAKEWFKQFWFDDIRECELQMWQECRSRAEVLIDKAIKDTVETCSVWNDREQQLRKAFEAGRMSILVNEDYEEDFPRDLEKAWQAYKEQK